MRDPAPEDRLAPLAALADPARRSLYQFVVAQAEPVGRDDAAQGVGVAHHVAKFHLDKLVDQGLLDIEYRRPPGRGGPGAGRPAKLYRRSDREIDVSVPARRYELAGRLLAEAVTGAQARGRALGDALEEAAAGAGRAIGAEVTRRAGGRRSPRRLVDRTVEVLAEHGYDPRLEDAGITLTNCPFHRLAQDYTELVCGMNHCLLTAMVDEADPGRDAGLHAVLEPGPERCCVQIRSRRPGSPSS